MNRIALLGGVAVLAALAARPALAAPAALPAPDASGVQTPDRPVFTVPELVVIGARPEATPAGVGAVAVTPDSLALSAAPTLEEVLREMPHLHVRTNSRGEAEISTRGSDSRQVAVLVDGVPLTLAWDSRADASVIPSSAPQELTFTRGLSSMLHGPNVLGGVVEVKVGSAAGAPVARARDARLGLDGAGGAAFSARVTEPLVTAGGSAVVRAGLGWRDTPGQALARGLVERTGGPDGLRLNTDAHAVDAFLSARRDGEGGGWVSFSGFGTRGRRGIAAELGVPDANTRFWRYPRVERGVTVVTAGTGERDSPLGGRGDLEASFGLDTGRTDIDAFADAAYDSIIAFEDGRDRTLTMRLLGDQTLGRRADLRGAFTLVSVRHDEAVPDGAFRYRQRLWSLGGETIVRVLDPGARPRFLKVSAGGAWDGAQTPESGGREPLGSLDSWGGRLGLSAGLDDGTTQLHAGVSRRSRFPSLRELYSGALNRFAPNPGLLPERLVAWEAGVTARAGRGEVQAVLFRNRLQDAVVRVRLPEPDNRFQRINRDRLDATGLELMASQDLGRLSASAHLTLQSVELTDPAAGTGRRPENLPEASGGLGLRARLPGGWTARLDAAWTGAQFAIDPATGQDSRLAPSLRCDLGVSRALGRHLEATATLTNIGDTVCLDQVGLPQPGRTLAVLIQLR